MIAGGADAKQTKAAEKSRKEEIEAEKKRIREVGIASHAKFGLNFRPQSLLSRPRFETEEPI